MTLADYEMKYGAPPDDDLDDIAAEEEEQPNEDLDDIAAPAEQQDQHIWKQPVFTCLYLYLLETQHSYRYECTNNTFLRVKH